MQKYKNQRKVKDTCKLLNTNENISVYFILTIHMIYALYYMQYHLKIQMLRLPKTYQPVDLKMFIIATYQKKFTNLYTR